MSQFPQTNTGIMEVKARSVDEAVAEALSALGITKDDAEIEIIQEPSKGFLGLGAKDAIVKVSAKNVISKAPAEKASEKSAETEAAVESAPSAPDTEKTNKLYSSESPAENAKSFISNVLTAMGLDVKIDAVLEDDVVKVQLEGENMGIVIGKRGDTLDSLQYLTSLVVNQNSEDYIKVSIDTENYRAKRAETLIALSNKLAARVAKTGRKYPLEEMNPYERRIIHSNLQDSEEVITYSVGQEPHRKVVIAPKNPKPYGKRGYGKKGSHKHPNGGKGGYSRPNYDKPARKPSAETSADASSTYKADFKPTPHKPEYKDFAEYLAAQSKK